MNKDNHFKHGLLGGFVGLQAQFNNYSYSKGECKVRLFDWYARAALGVRL